MNNRALWTVDAMITAMRARAAGPLPTAIGGISIDSRTITPGDAFFAITGDSRDGHEFVDVALAAGAGLAVVSESKLGSLPSNAPLLVVGDVLEALRELALAARARSSAQIVAVTGSVGKTGTKEALRLILAEQAETHASAASYNNHWGVPLSLARMPASARFGVFELGMNHAGELTPLTRLVRPHVAVVTTVEAVHLEHFHSVEDIADAKAEIFAGLEAAGAAVINRDNPHFARLRQRAERAGVKRIVSFGEHADADVRLMKTALKSDCSIVDAQILGEAVTYKIGSPGRHVVLNSLAVLAAVKLLGGDLAIAALALARLQPPVGRGQRLTLALPNGAALLIDESYNANPASMRAAIALLGQSEVGRSGRRIAVLGDMLELGQKGPELHRDLLEPIIASDVDLVFCAGPLIKSLWEALPSERRGGYAESASALEPQVLAVVRDGDVLMVKASNGSRMGSIVKALTRRFVHHEAVEQAPAEG
ncbi:MAG TPA: UDP-N-acetylmuramoylalanyl-D-glutamyl-2,6-diaminopimelate--D-alanyl-D-alanine ligase [Xanthobacteraceae bacterium]|jgi:UDP-N-acetylmuramoyl-tripeptide--D-alanyl-D-alanine ligase|nr:UDP-N-acetylmuramoylalanyl-D-glutamyl-2,6-diaminopimelate--D-alanyl-D-alanine ligase [Xanthobacteraceae bacterium]